MVCKPHDIYDETSCLNYIKLCSKEFYMILLLQGSKKLMKGTYFDLQIGPNALIFAQFGVLIIRTMAVPPLYFIHDIMRQWRQVLEWSICSDSWV